jgi:serine/threonine-protein kinase
VAVKLLRTSVADDPEFAARFRHEARTAAALRHPNVAPVYDFDAGGEGRPAYLVTAYIAGEPLDRKIGAAGRLGPAETMSIVAQAANALHAVHEVGVVHRDVKPGNLIVQADGSVVLIDFGIARSAQAAAVTAPDEAVGTARYMAPEQVAKQPLTPAVDIYALGVVAYHCLAGRPPFLGENPATVAMSHLQEDPPPLPTDVPPAVRDVVSTAMAKKPADRFPTAAAMAAAAAETAGPGVAGALGAGTSAAPLATGVAAAQVTPARRRRRAATWAAILVALTALGIVLAIADPIGVMPGPGSPPASPAPASPGTGGGSGGDGSPGGAGGSGAPGGPGAPGGATPGGGGGTPGGGGTTPGGGTGPTPAPSGTEPTGPTATGSPNQEPTTNPAPTATDQPNATTTGSQAPG